MKKVILITLFLVPLLLCVEGRKTARSRSSGSGKSRNPTYKSNPQPVPTSFSNPQPSAPKPSLFGWQEKPAQRTQTSSRQSSPSGSKTHSYPSSQTGLSGSHNNQPKSAPSYQENIQKSHAPQPTNNKPNNNGYPASTGLSGNGGYPPSSGLSGNSASSGQGSPVQNNIQKSNAPQLNNQPNNGYPASNGLSGSGGYPPSSGLSGNNAASGHGYPAQGGSYGSGVAPPPYSAPGSAQHSYPGAGAAPPPYSGYKPGSNYGSNNYGNYHQGPPPPYSNVGPHYGGYGGSGGFGGHGSQMPGYFGNYGNRGFGGPSRTSTALKGVGIAGAGVGTLLTGLALWNLARSTGHHRHTVIYDNRGQPVAVAPNNSSEPVVDSILGDLVNCTLTVSSPNATEVLGIPCSIATSFTPEADVKENEQNVNTDDKTECIVTVVTKAGKEFMTTIPCSILLRTAAENNVTEPPELPNNNGTDITTENVTLANQPSALMLSGATNDPNNGSLNCTMEPGDVRDPINPCFAVTHNLTVIPLDSTSEIQSTPGVA